MARSVREVDMERSSFWHWRIIVVGDGWTDEHDFRGPRWLARRHVRGVYHDRHNRAI